jgi:hypothetical protein
LGAAAVGRDGQAAADNFAERGEVGFDVEKLLRRSVVQTKAGDDFVDDQQRAILFRDLAQPREKTRCRRNDTHVGGDRLNDDGSNFVFFLC